ncbi:PIG-L deacetylase family protein [Shewanella psychrophila]|nr:PIG-L deacetylase family protein [Shewanella psychrophila]
MFLTLLACSCQLTRETKLIDTQSVVVLLAHPDDETWVSGTLAKLADLGIKVFPVYATSGDAGSDHSGQGLSGSKLAKVREQEALEAVAILGLQAPIFLRFSDGKLNQDIESLLIAVHSIIEREKPQAILTFVRGGITDNLDHKTMNILVETYFSKLGIYFGVSESQADELANSASKFALDYRVARPIDDAEVSIKVDITAYKIRKIMAMESHITQFPPVMNSAYEDYLESFPQEELVTGNNACRLILLTTQPAN